MQIIITKEKEKKKVLIFMLFLFGFVQKITLNKKVFLLQIFIIPPPTKVAGVNNPHQIILN